MFVCTLASIGMLNVPEDRSGVPFTLFIGALPIFFRFLSNYCKEYVVTTERLYLEDGILAKSKKDIPLNKINDIELTQGIIQRMVGSGNLLVLTGNDKSKRLKDISNPEKFKNEVSQLLRINTSAPTAVMVERKAA